ncbi:hypothetical protein OXT66_02120 [Lentilactobacillus senioris]|uniref:hypothetical protein n=1 Tax=Lentilactobacillus senioris TaxID=931534 RepID=UPI00227F93F6|nr:hypothetical protein [Lentilactobacillus senioris]MCY9806343.1 hypothetical protein [Lentilactobacillus senioris]
MLTYKDPMYTVYGSGRVITDSTKYANDVLTITKQGTRTREGDQWVYVTDEANPSVSGWILKSGLTKTSDVPASQGITIKYYDKKTNEVVKTVVIKADKDKTVDLTSEANLASDVNANKPAGYADATASDVASNGKAAKAGDSVNVYLTAAIQYNVTLYANNPAGEVAVITNLYSYLSQTQKDALVKALQDNKAPEGSDLTTDMINKVISEAGLDSFTFTGKDGNTYTATYNKSVQFVSSNTVTTTAKPNALYTITMSK